jgi:hypothetical protein
LIKNKRNIITKTFSGRMVDRLAEMKAKNEEVTAIHGTIFHTITFFFEKLNVLNPATKTIVAKLVAIASKWLNGKMKLRRGTMIIPPPIPKIVDTSPTLIPIKKIVKYVSIIYYLQLSIK